MSILFIGCEKENLKDQPRNTDNSMHSLYGSVTCPRTEMLNVDLFNSNNKIPDAPIDPVTIGTPQSIAENNYQRIQWCLTKYHEL